MAENFITGMQQGSQAANQMIFGYEQAKAQTSLLSSKAEEAQLQVAQQRQIYTARMNAMVSENQIAKARSDIDQSTNQGRIQALTMALKATKDVATQEFIRDQIKQANLDNASSVQEQASIKENQATLAYDTVAQALTSRTGDDWDRAIQAALPENKAILTQVRDLHMSDAYTKLSPREQRTVDDTILARLAPAKAGAAIMRATQDANYQTMRTQYLEDKIALDTKIANQKEALIREGKTSKAALDTIRSEDELRKVYEAMSNTPQTINNPDSHFYNTAPSKIPNPVYQGLLEQKARLEKKLSGSMDTLESTLKEDTQTSDDTEQATIKTQLGDKYDPDNFEYKIIDGHIMSRPKSK